MEFKRQYRECPEEVKRKISAALANRPKSSSHREKISVGMKNYWKDVPSIHDTTCNSVEDDGFDDDKHCISQ